MKKIGRYIVVGFCMIVALCCSACGSGKERIDDVVVEESNLQIELMAIVDDENSTVGRELVSGSILDPAVHEKIIITMFSTNVPENLPRDATVEIGAEYADDSLKITAQVFKADGGRRKVFAEAEIEFDLVVPTGLYYQNDTDTTFSVASTSVANCLTENEDAIVSNLTLRVGPK